MTPERLIDIKNLLDGGDLEAEELIGIAAELAGWAGDRHRGWKRRGLRILHSVALHALLVFRHAKQPATILTARSFLLNALRVAEANRRRYRPGDWGGPDFGDRWFEGEE